MSKAVGWLRLEGAAVLVLSIGAYAYTGSSWWLFAALLFAPDLFMLGYLAGPRTGALVYNIGHVYLLPAVMGCLGFWLNQPLLWAMALIWTAHIGLDRMLGYGLKFPDRFQHTHLGVVGKHEALGDRTI